MLHIYSPEKVLVPVDIYLGTYAWRGGQPAGGRVPRGPRLLAAAARAARPCRLRDAVELRC
jgi:hypothetical protein